MKDARQSESDGMGKQGGSSRDELDQDCRRIDALSPKTKSLLGLALRRYQRHRERAGRRVPARLFTLLNLLDHAETQELPLKNVGERLGVRPELLLAAIKRGRLAGNKTAVDHPPGHVWCTTVQAARQYLGEAEAWRRQGWHRPKAAREET